MNENNFTDVKKQIDAIAITKVCELFPRWEFKETANRYFSPYHSDGRKGNGENIYIYKNGCNVNENGRGGLSCSLYDFFCMDRGLIPATRQSLEEYANANGFVIPDTEEMKRQRQKEQADERERQYLEMEINGYVKALEQRLTADTAEGAKLRAFFVSRGWSPEFVAKWRIGYDSANQTNPLTFPILRNGKPCQIARRWDLLKDEERAIKEKGVKYPPKFLNGKGNDMQFLGFAPVPTMANRSALFIAEGIPDAIALNNAGFAGACTFSNNMNGGQLKEIEARQKRGLQNVYLIADNDQAGDTATPRNGRLLEDRGVNVFVISFSDVDGCKDVDDYLSKQQHTPDEFRERAEHAPTFAIYMHQRHRMEYMQTKDLNKYFADVAGLLCRAEASGRNNDFMAIYNAMETNAKGDGYLFSLFETTLQRAKAGDPNAQPQPVTNEDTEREERAKALFPQHQAGDIRRVAGEFSPEIETGYLLETMDDRANPEPWKIPADDVTLICGYTSHGKTKVLQNLFLNMAYDPNAKGRFLFVSYEESDGAIIRELVNIRVNEALTNDPRQTNIEAIGDYLATGGATQCNGHAQKVERVLNELDDMATKGRICIAENNAPVEILADAIRQQVEQYKGNTETGEIKAVFVDYIQLLEMEHPEKLAPNIVLKNIILQLHNVAKETQTAIICGAQLKREERDKNPVFITESDIADSAYLERTAAEVVILYDGNKLKGREFAQITARDGRPNDGQTKIFKKGFANPTKGETLEELEAFGRMYLKICKHRGRRAGVEGVLQYTPSTGNISQLPPEVWNDPIWTNLAEMWGVKIDQAKAPAPQGNGATAGGFGQYQQPQQMQMQYTAPSESQDGETLPF